MFRLLISPYRMKEITYQLSILNIFIRRRVCEYIYKYR